MQTTNQKNDIFPLSQSLSWRRPADQKAWGLWVRDCYPRVSPGAAPLTKKPEDSGYEIAYPRKRGIPVFVRMLTIKAEVKCPKVAAALLLLGLKVLSGLESVRESQNWFYTRSKGTGFFPVRADQSNWIFFLVRASERWTNSTLLQQTSINIFLYYCLYLQIKRNHHFSSHRTEQLTVY